MDGYRRWNQVLRLEGRFGVALLGVVVGLLALALPATALAAFPGANGKIAFASANGLEVANADGTGRTVLASDGTDPAWSADGTKIAFTTNRDGNNEIYVMNANGNTQTRMTNNAASDSMPAWSPDGSRIVFISNRDGNNEIYTMTADGSNQFRTTNTPAAEYDPKWSPLNDKIAFSRSGGIYTMNVDGSGTTQLPTTTFYCEDASHYDYPPDWSPTGQFLVFAHFEEDFTCTEFEHWEIHTINADGTGESNLFEDYGVVNPVWSPDDTKFVMDNAGGGVYIRDMAGNFGWATPDYACCPDWQPVLPTQPGYARPLSASPTTIKLVPAYKTCASANSTHGAPLAAPSCNPPRQTSDYVTVGTPDVNGAGANSTGLVAFRAICHPPDGNGVPECPAPGDQIDIALTASLTDVRNKSDLTDYTGELRVSVSTRITDRYNLPGGVAKATAADTPFSFNLPCQTTTDTAVGSTCSTSTSADAIMPGLVLENKRAVWELGQVQVYDGGADGDADTTGDNTLFMDQGLFAP
jgi:hypothetical protein